MHPLSLYTVLSLVVTFHYNVIPNIHRLISKNSYFMKCFHKIINLIRLSLSCIIISLEYTVYTKQCASAKTPIIIIHAITLTCFSRKHLRQANCFLAPAFIINRTWDNGRCRESFRCMCLCVWVCTCDIHHHSSASFLFL